MVRGDLYLRDRSPRAALEFRGLMHHDITQRNQTLQFFAIHNRQMPKAVLVHDEKALLDTLIDMHRTWVCGHHFRDRRVPWGAACGDYTVHNVALGKNSGQLPVAQHRQSANVVFRHKARSLQHRTGCVNRVHFAVFHEVTKSVHGNSFGTGWIVVLQASQIASGITLSQGSNDWFAKRDRSQNGQKLGDAGEAWPKTRTGSPVEPQAICLAVLEAEARSDTRSEIVVGDVQETDVISNFDPNSRRPGESFDPPPG
jgi:hypothetical protein